MALKLPVFDILPELKEALFLENNIVLQAPPGAGKTTVIPIELLNEIWLNGKKIIMLEPRRLAARAAAERMAHTIGEKVGETVGYRVRMDQKISQKTRIEVVTEGILNRQIQQDPDLADVGLIIFDEFHERSIDADLGLAFVLDVQEALRDDLKVLIMSATLDGKAVSKLMDEARVISSEGRSYPVEINYFDHTPKGRVEEYTSDAILRALNDDEGSILVFLPGAGEIERTKKILEQKLRNSEVMLCPLYGMMSFKDQDHAISPAPEGRRKVVLATAIAESSLTIEGIRIVIDSGLQRYSEFDIKTGMSGLTTKMVSMASADQRAGRAGRVMPGICYRLWSKAGQRLLDKFTIPEIERVDLLPLTLSLAGWGVQTASSLKWINPPDEMLIIQAQKLLRSLGALSESCSLTAHGEELAILPTHPRLAHMIIKAKELGQGYLALLIAALIEEKDILRQSRDYQSSDMRLRIEALMLIHSGEVSHAKKMGCDISRAKRILKQVSQWLKQYKITSTNPDINKTGLCLAMAFPDRIGGKRHQNDNSYLLSGGRGAALQNDDPLLSERFIAIGSLDKGQSNAKVFLAAPVEKTDLEEHFAHMIHEQNTVSWDYRQKSVKAEKLTKLDQMVLSRSKSKDVDPEQISFALCEGIRKLGFSSLPWEKESSLFCKRAILLKEHEKEFPDFSEEFLLENLEDWLAPYLGGINSVPSLSKIDLKTILRNRLSWDEQNLLEEYVPEKMKVPSGSNIRIDYSKSPPALPVKLQEMFGAIKTPEILGGKIKLSVHLLSPAMRPIQITNDLHGFWSSSYEEVKKEMKGRYPKHYWPDDPMQAVASRKTTSKKR